MDQIAEQTRSLIQQANSAESLRNCYLQREKSPDLPDNHPRNIFNPASYSMIAADLIDDQSPLKQLYFWPLFQQLVADIVGVKRLYPSADPLQPVNIICYGDGDQSAWHYDSNNAFTMTLMLQEPDAGGAFELAPNTRQGEEDEDMRYTRDVLNGRSSEVQTISRSAGELTIFRGCNSLHRVTTVEGSRLRLMAVFVYEDEPGVIGDPEVNRTVYGRTGQ